MKLVIESAPVALIVTDSAGEILAANKAALALFRAERLDEVLKKYLSKLVATDDRDRMVAFIGTVCGGEAGMLEYEVVEADGTRRAFQTSAVPLQREAGAARAFLSATWDVTKRIQTASADPQTQVKLDRAEADKEALSEALRKTEAANQNLSHEHAIERKTFEDELHEVRSRLQHALAETEGQREHLASQWSTERETLVAKVNNHAIERKTFEDELHEVRSRLQHALADAEGQREHLASQWSTEREALVAKVDNAESRHAQLAAQLLTEQQARQTALDRMEQAHQASLAALTAQRQRAEHALGQAQARHEEEAAAAHAEREALAVAAQQLELRLAELTDRGRVEREALEDSLRAENTRCARLVADQAQWQVELIEIVQPMRDASARIEALLNQGQEPDSVKEPTQVNQTVETQQVNQTVETQKEDEDSSWGF